MNCNEARRQWNLYYDSEGTPDLFQQINQHLETCPECAGWYRRQEVLEEELTRRLSAGEATPDIWASILPSATNQTASKSGHSRLLLSLVAVLSACVLIAVGLMSRPKPQQPVAEADLAELSSRWHQELSAGRQPIDFRSSSDLEVERYLRDRVEFPVRCPPRKDTGFLVSGAGICRLGGQKAAYLVGKLHGENVSIFILSRDSLHRFPQHSDVLKKTIDCRQGDFGLAMAAVDRNLVLVIGRASCSQLTRVVRAYGTYPHDGDG